MTRKATRAALAALAAQAPAGLTELAGVALAQYDRWQLIETTRTMHTCCGWIAPSDPAQDIAWRARAFAWIAGIYLELLEAGDQNAALDQADRLRK